MNSGIFAYFGYELPLAQRLRLIRQAGFTHTALWWGPPDETFLAGKIHDAPAMVRDLGLVLENIHVPFEACNELWSPSATTRAAFVSRHLRWLEDCVRHRVSCMVLHVTHGTNAPDATPAGTSAFQQLVGAAEQAGVLLAVENTRRTDILDCLLDAYPSSAVGFCYDSSHDWLWTHPRLGTLRRWGHRLAQTHLSDAGDGEDRHLLPASGRIDWDAVAQAFPVRTYPGVLLLEVISASASEPPQQFLAEAHRQLAWLAARLGQ